MAGTRTPGGGGMPEVKAAGREQGGGGARKHQQGDQDTETGLGGQGE